jgi:hypothetical protein
MPDTDPFALPQTSEQPVTDPKSATEAPAPATEAPESAEATEPEPTTEAPARPAVADDVLLVSVDVARAALLEITPESTIGAPAGHIVEGEHLLSLLFECTMLGYPDWYWTVSLARVDDGSAPSVLEAELMPGDGALLAPDWVPWSERLAEYQASQEAARASEPNSESDDAAADDEDDDLDDVDSDEVDDGDIDGVDIDALHERADDDDYDGDEQFESDDITGVELATLELQEDESDDAEGDTGDGGPEHPDGVRAGQDTDEEAEDDEGSNP